MDLFYFYPYPLVKDQMEDLVAHFLNFLLLGQMFNQLLSLLYLPKILTLFLEELHGLQASINFLSKIQMRDIA